jgi:hypothetical protein
MSNPRAKKSISLATQESLFSEPNTPPSLPLEVLPEVRAALVELLLEAAQQKESGDAHERQDH